MAELPTTIIVDRESINKNEIGRFLKALDPTAETFLFVAVKDNARPQITRQPVNDLVLNSLDHWNEQGYNIFVTVNETLNGTGTARHNEDVTKFRCIYADDDAKQIPNPYPIPPSAIIESSPGKKQVYWFIDDCPGKEIWDGVQQTLVNYYAGDKEARDAARILRLPGLYNTKSVYTTKPRSKILSLDNHRYSWAQIIEAFPASEVLRDTGQPMGETLDIKLTLEQFISGENYHGAGIRLAAHFFNSGMTDRDKLILHMQSLIDIQGDHTDLRFNHRRNVDIPGSVDWIIKKRAEEAVANAPVMDIFQTEGSVLEKEKFTQLPKPGGAMGSIVDWVMTLQRYPNETIAIIVAEHLVSVFGGGHYHIQNNTTTRKRIMLAPLGTGKNTIVRAMTKLTTALAANNSDNMPWVLNADQFIGADSFSFSTQHKQIEEHRVRSFIVNEAGESGKSKSGDMDNLRAYQLQALSTKADEAFYPKKYSEQGSGETKQMNVVHNGVWVYMHESTLKSYAMLLADSGSFVNGDLSRSDIFFIDPHMEDEVINISSIEGVPIHIVKLFANLANDFRATGTMSGINTAPVWDAVDTTQIDSALLGLEIATMKKRNQAFDDDNEVMVAILGRLHERILTTILICSLADAAWGDGMDLPVAKQCYLDYSLSRAEAINNALLFHANKGGVLSGNPFDQATKQFIEKFQELTSSTKKAQRKLQKAKQAGQSADNWILNYTAFANMLQRGPYQQLVKSVYREDAKRARAAFIEHLEGLEIISPQTYLGTDNQPKRIANRWWLDPTLFPVKPH